MSKIYNLTNGSTLIVYRGLGGRLNRGKNIRRTLI